MTRVILWIRILGLVILSVVSWGWGFVSWGFVSYGFFFRVAWSSFIGNFNNISGVAIGSVVFNNLCAAIWKVDTIFSRGSVTITRFICGKVDSGIIVSCRVSESVFWGYVFWSFVGWGMVKWSSMVNWGIKSGWVVGRSSLVSR